MLLEDVLNQWMTRIAGLLSSSCFQRNEAVQHRALVAFGVFSATITPGEIEDDLMVSDLQAELNVPWTDVT